FAAAYHRLEERFGSVCFKFVRDEGGQSYHRIDNSQRGYQALFHPHATRITFDEAFAALSERETFAPLLVMPYLSGDEISADCLQTEDGLIILPRIKGATRVERMCFSEEILRITHEVCDAVKLQCPCNIQFKYLGDVPYFLEVNTRMSGGVQMACAASGVNIPDIAVNKLLGIRKPWTIQKEERFVTYVETPVIL
ncbi:MAG: ATP-grasp domain-containing protein, partial [Oscillospiraceae bacterium]|nr:ATP-grasp domain-containing protein [Oscillospiraceae bacterium]